MSTRELEIHLDVVTQLVQQLCHFLKRIACILVTADDAVSPREFGESLKQLDGHVVSIERLAEP